MKLFPNVKALITNLIKVEEDEFDNFPELPSLEKLVVMTYYIIPLKILCKMPNLKEFIGCEDSNPDMIKPFLPKNCVYSSKEDFEPYEIIDEKPSLAIHSF